MLPSKLELFNDTKRIIFQTLELKLSVIEQKELKLITDSVFDRGMVNSLSLREKIKNNKSYDISNHFDWESEAAILFFHDYYSIPINSTFDLFYHGTDKEEISEYIRRQQEREHHYML